MSNLFKDFSNTSVSSNLGVLYKIYKEFCFTFGCSEASVKDSFKVAVDGSIARVRVFFDNIDSAYLFLEAWGNFVEYGESSEDKPYFVESLDDSVRQRYVGIFSDSLVISKDNEFYIEAEFIV